MGYRFSLQHINWLAALLDPYHVPRISNLGEFRNALREFLGHPEGRFLSSPRYEWEFRNEILQLVESLEDFDQYRSSRSIESEALFEQQTRWHYVWREWAHFSRGFLWRPWTACIIPSGTDRELDRELCSFRLLRDLVREHPEHPGLILQPEEPPGDHFSLLDAVPSMRLALNNMAKWPALLVWSDQGEVMLPIGRDRGSAISRLHAAMSLLYSGVEIDGLDEAYHSQCGFADLGGSEGDPVHIIQLSDTHIGSIEAGTRLRHLLHLTRTLRGDLGSRTIPVISGDFFDTPDDSQSDSVANFIEDVHRAVGEVPFCVVGNHDLRDGGWAKTRPGPMMETHVLEPIRKYEHLGVTFVGFNSCEGGHLARGEISESQLQDRNRRLDDAGVGLRIGVVHHHPLKVEHPSWEYRSFIERFLGPVHAPTVEMVNGDQLIGFCASKGVGVLLHGHKHIPRFAESESVRVIGCGSSVGKIKTRDGKPYLSVNVLTVFPKSGRVITRMLADRTHGGLQDRERHEFISLN